MGAFSIWHWLIVLAVVLLLFGGRGKISGLMGDLGKGLKAFKSNIKDEKGGESPSETTAQVEHQSEEEQDVKAQSSTNEKQNG